MICGAGAFFAGGNRLFSADNNFRNVYGSRIVPEDWKSDPYWGAWLVGEWCGVLITGIFAVRPANTLSSSTTSFSVLLQLVYYTISPFFTNSGRLFGGSSDDSYEV